MGKTNLHKPYTLSEKSSSQQIKTAAAFFMPPQLIETITASTIFLLSNISIINFILKKNYLSLWRFFTGMVQAKCIQKFKDKHGKITGYLLEDCNKQQLRVSPDQLKMALFSQQIQVTNLKFTKDGRLIDADNTESPLNNWKVAFEELWNYMKTLCKNEHSYEDVDDEYVRKLMSKIFGGQFVKLGYGTDVYCLGPIHYVHTGDEGDEICLSFGVGTPLMIYCDTYDEANEENKQHAMESIVYLKSILSKAPIGWQDIVSLITCELNKFTTKKLKVNYSRGWKILSQHFYIKDLEIGDGYVDADIWLEAVIQGEIPGLNFTYHSKYYYKINMCEIRFCSDNLKEGTRGLYVYNIGSEDVKCTKSDKKDYISDEKYYYENNRDRIEVPIMKKNELELSIYNPNMLKEIKLFMRNKFMESCKVIEDRHIN